MKLLCCRHASESVASCALQCPGIAPLVLSCAQCRNLLALQTTPWLATDHTMKDGQTTFLTATGSSLVSQGLVLLLQLDILS